MTTLQNFVDQFGLGISKEKLVDKAYYTMEALGYDVCILNEKYLIVNGINYQFIKSRKEARWIVKAF